MKEVVNHHPGGGVSPFKCCSLNHVITSPMVLNQGLVQSGGQLLRYLFWVGWRKADGGVESHSGA